MRSQWKGASPSVSVEAIATQLKHCSKVQDLRRGKLIHGFITESEEYGHNTFLVNSVVHMYGSCRSFSDARDAFSNIRSRNAHSWNIYLDICVKSGEADEAFRAFVEMQRERAAQMNSYTCVSVMNACAKWARLEMGRNVFSAMAMGSCETELVSGTAAVKMYGRCGAVEDAKRVFDSMPDKDLVAWSSIVGAFARNNRGLEAMELYRRMQDSCHVPDRIASLCAIDACSCIREPKRGQRVHIAVVESGHSGDVAVSTSLVSMYGKCGDPAQACAVLAQVREKNRIAWNSAIQMLASNSRSEEAVSLFRRMQLEGSSPDASTCVSALGACSSVSLLQEGRKLHSISAFLDGDGGGGGGDGGGDDADGDGDGDGDDAVVLQTAILAMYGRCEALGEAEKLFGSSSGGMMLRGDVVAWCTIITACIQNGRDDEALGYFGRMMHDAKRIDPDAAIFVSALDACARLSALDRGQMLHMAIVEQRHEGNVTVATALVAMYGRCGSVQDAESVFFFFSSSSSCFRVVEGCQNVVFWSAMIGAYAHSGLENEAIDLFREMQERAIASNEVTMRSVLTACSYGGGEIADLIRSRAHLQMMMMMRENEPVEGEHSLSVVDLLGRMGRLDEAQDVAHRVPEEKRAMAWACLLGACRMHDDVERGARIAARLLELEPDNAASYVSLSNLYSSRSE